MLTPGIKGHAALRVTTENTALAMGSGELPVLATPAVAALIERACWQSVAAELELDQGTVGTALTLAHTAPTPVGMVVHCDCELTHERYIVDNERFTRKANSKLTAQS